MKMSGAKMILEALAKEKVDTIFGYPGGSVIGLYDEIYDSTDIVHILTRHEQGAIHAADGYARATEKPGVVIATSGPGATNLVTGIANAYMDSVPLVIFTGQIGTTMIGTDGFQEADITGITLPITKHNYLVKDVNDLPNVIKEAFYIANTGRRGPVLIDIPKDVLAAEGDFQYPEEIDIPGYHPTYQGHRGQISRTIREINRAERPIIYAGGGVTAAGAHQELLEFAETLQIPVTTTLMGIGSFPGDHPLFLGMLGMHGTYWANYATTECDLLIAIGARFDDRVTGKLDSFAPDANVIHIDIDPAEIGKNVAVKIPIVGDVKIVLTDLIKKIKKRENLEWVEKIVNWKKEHPLHYDNTTGELKPQFVIQEICRLTEGKALIATEVGQHQMWTAQYYTFTKPRSLYSSGGLGTMGYGFPASIGAQIGRKDELVFCIAGDGSFQMNSQELATIAAYKIPVKIAIINNQCLGMVRQWQELFFKKRYSSTDLASGPDFVKLAEAYGVVGLRASTPGQVEDVIKKALEIPGPVLIDFKVCQEENVFPMVPPNSPITNLLEGK